MVNQGTIALFTFEEAHAEGTFPEIKKHASLISVYQFGSIKYHLDLFMPMLLDMIYKPRNYELNIIQ